MRVREDVEAALAQLKEPLIPSQTTVETIKSIALAYEAFTKVRTKGLKGLLKSSFVKLRFVLHVIRDTRKLVEYQKILGDYLIAHNNEMNPEVQVALSYVCEYLSFLVVNFFSTIEEAIDRAFVDDLKDRLKLRTKEIAIKELIIRKNLGIDAHGATSEQLEDQFYKVRLLKKYFQKSLFVNVEAERFAPKVLQPIAGLAAGAAALWAGFFQLAQTDHRFILGTGITPIGLLSIGVVAYVVKDRIKDTLKAKLAGRVEKVLPDVEKKLFYQMPDSEPQQLGLIRETMRRLKTEQLPVDIKDLRYTGGHSGLERELGEDIIHYGKRIKLNKKAHRLEKEQVGLREILRLNLSPYLHKLDDPFKEISFVNESGQIGRSEVHRLYYAHLAVKVSSPDHQGSHSQVYLTRLALDRKGIVRISNC